MNFFTSRQSVLRGRFERTTFLELRFGNEDILFQVAEKDCRIERLA
jgi:hypothetical protein